MSGFRRYAAASALAAMIAACKENIGPARAVPDISGEWVYSEDLGPAEDHCDTRGLYAFLQTGATFTGTTARFVGGCPFTPAVGYIPTGQVSDSGITFAVGTCQYTGTFRGARPDSVAGTFSCTPSWIAGTWAAARTGPAASLALGLSARTMAVGGTTQLDAVLTDGAGHVLYGRPVGWSSDNPAAVTVSTLDITELGNVVGVAPGSATVTATSAGVSASARFTVKFVSFASLDAGGWDTCGLSTGGDLYCWGAGWGLGDGSNIGSNAPVAVPGSLAFSSVSVGGFEACGLAAAGAAYCWGSNPNGWFVNGLGSTPTPVSGAVAFVSVSTGGDHACGLTAGGMAYCWGNNANGQLGNGTRANSPMPVAVSGGLKFTMVSAGGTHSCGVASGGAAYCWGENSFNGRLGDGTTTDRPTPVAVSGGLAFASVSAAVNHTCGLTVAGSAYCWGVDVYGQLGDSSSATIGSTTPVAVVGGLTFASVSAGETHSCGVTSGGLAYCWGDNVDGELGNGATAARQSTPVVVSGGLTFASLSAGSGKTCGLTTGGVAYCWGYLSGGGSSSVPVRVTGQP